MSRIPRLARSVAHSSTSPGRVALSSGDSCRLGSAQTKSMKRGRYVDVIAHPKSSHGTPVESVERLDLWEKATSSSGDCKTAESPSARHDARAGVHRRDEPPPERGSRPTFDDLHDLLQMPTAQRRGNIHDACGPPLVNKPLETDSLIYSAFVSHGFHH